MTFRSFRSVRRVIERGGETLVLDVDLTLARVERHVTLPHIAHVRDHGYVDRGMVGQLRLAVAGLPARAEHFRGARGYCGRDTGRGRDRGRSLQKLPSTRRFHCRSPSS